MAVIAIAFFASCEKQGSDRFKGNYSFKTSGTLTIVRDAEYVNDTTYRFRDGAIDTVVTEHSEPITIALASESGQMDVTVVNAKEDRLVVTMNVLGGDMLVYYAAADGNELALDPAGRHLSVHIPGVDGMDEELGIRPVSTEVKVDGRGERYDDIMLLELSYSGDFWANDRLYHIIDSDIVCRAKLNK